MSEVVLQTTQAGSATLRLRDPGKNLTPSHPTQAPSTNTNNCATNTLSNVGMASSEPATELGNALSQCGLNLPLAPQEPTYLSLDREFISGSPQRLSVRVDAPYGATAADVTVSQDCEWQYPFRLARVLTRLPVEGIPFLYPDAWRTKIDSIINNLIASASLVIPSTPPASGYTTLKLRAVARPSDDPRLFNCVLIEIPVPIGITLRHGAIISLRISVCGIPITVDIPAKGHIHSGTCKHTQEGKGAVWSAAYASDVAALESALAAGGSTEEADEVSSEYAGSGRVYIIYHPRLRERRMETQR